MPPAKVEHLRRIQNESPLLLTPLGGQIFAFRSIPSTATRAFTARRELTSSAALASLPTSITGDPNRNLVYGFGASQFLSALNKTRKGCTIRTATEILLSRVSTDLLLPLPLLPAEAGAAAPVRKATLRIAFRGEEKLRHFTSSGGGGEFRNNAQPTSDFKLESRYPDTVSLKNMMQSNIDLLAARLLDVLLEDKASNLLSGKVSTVQLLTAKDMRGKGKAHYADAPLQDISLNISQVTGKLAVRAISASRFPGEDSLALLVNPLVPEARASDGERPIYVNYSPSFDSTLAYQFLASPEEVCREGGPPYRLFRQLVLRRSLEATSSVVMYWDEVRHLQDTVSLGPLGGNKLPADCRPAFAAVLDMLVGASVKTAGLQGLSPVTFRRNVEAEIAKGFPMSPHFPDIRTVDDVRILSVEALAIMLFSFYFNKYRSHLRPTTHAASLATFWSHVASNHTAVVDTRELFSCVVKESGFFAVSFASNSKDASSWLPSAGVMLAVAAHTRELMLYLRAILSYPYVLPPITAENGYLLDPVSPVEQWLAPTNLLTGAYLGSDGHIVVVPPVAARGRGPTVGGREDEEEDDKEERLLEAELAAVAARVIEEEDDDEDGADRDQRSGEEGEAEDRRRSRRQRRGGGDDEDRVRFADGDDDDEDEDDRGFGLRNDEDEDEDDRAQRGESKGEGDLEEGDEGFEDEEEGLYEGEADDSLFEGGAIFGRFFGP